MKCYVCGNIRIQMFNSDVIRIEYGPNGTFCDENTFFIPDKKKSTNQVVYKIESPNDVEVLTLGDISIQIPVHATSLQGIKVYQGQKLVYLYKPKYNSGELPPLYKTPFVFALSDCPRILMPANGYTAQNAEGDRYTVDEEAQDIYLLVCRGDAKKLRQIYVELTGRNEMVRLSTLGVWNSKYYAYTQQTALKVMRDYVAYRIPLDNLVIDTDWRATSDRGIGYDVDTNLFPDMEGFLAEAHKNGVEIMFNDHPEPVEGATSVFDPKEIAYREEKLQNLLKMGVDIWWYDRNWITKLKSPTPYVDSETLGMYLFTDITRHYFQAEANNKKIYRRPVIMGNVDNIANGAYVGINNSASHRYSIQWTGDIGSTLDVLAQEVKNLILASNNGIAYINSDCGGHTGNPTKAEYIRWIQYGVFSPVFRPHCTKDVLRYREPWLYDIETLQIAKEYIAMRYRLMPVLYAQAHTNYQTGLPIFRALGFAYPQEKKALMCTSEYMLGNNVLVAPIMGQIPVMVEESRYLTPVKTTFYNGRFWQGLPIYQTTSLSILLDCNHTAPFRDGPVYNYSAIFETTLQFDKEVELLIRCDDGATVWIDDYKVLEDTALHSATNFSLGILSPRTPHKIVIKYFQAGGEAYCGLLYQPARRSSKTQVYLPKDTWLNAFSGEVVKGGRCISERYTLAQMPLYLRVGGVLPLAYVATNTKMQKWDRLVYDYYPDKVATDEGELYEDDGETTAYQYGKFRTSPYRSYFDVKRQAYVLRLSAANGTFKGKRACTQREVSVKFHKLPTVEQISKVTLNGNEVPFTLHRRNTSAMPLSTAPHAPDSDTFVITFTADVASSYEVAFTI
jgi:alpha-glucosidase (family GH31 glycosyl hydrolase)